MMRSRLAVFALMAGGWGLLPGFAAADDFTPAQRQEIVSIVRQALKSDPSILRDAVVSLRADEEKQQEASQAGSISAHSAALTDGRGDAVAGNPSGNVTLVEFYDPRCPYCKRMVPVIDGLIGSDPKLRVVFKLIPILGLQSVLEARAIAAAGAQGAYVPMQDALMRDNAPVTAETIASIARSLKIDGAKLARDMNSPAVTSHLDDNIALARALKIDGTPAIVIGDQMISGAVDQGDLEKAVAAARS